MVARTHMARDANVFAQTLQNFEEKKDSPKESFELSSAQLSVAGERKFVIKNDKGGKLELQAATEEEFSDWVRSIRTNILTAGERHG